MRTLNCTRALPDRCSSLKFIRSSIPSGSSFKQLSEMLRISSFSNSRVDKVSYLSLFWANLSTIRLFLSNPISDGIISNWLQSKFMCVSCVHSLIRPDKYLIWFLAAYNLLRFYSCMKIRPSSSTIRQLLISSTVTWLKIDASWRTSLGTYMASLRRIFNLTSPVASFVIILNSLGC